MGKTIVTCVLERLAETIEKTIVPDLTSEFASQQAVATASLLRVFAPIVELNHQKVTEENIDMQQTIDTVVHCLIDDTEGGEDSERDELLKRLNAKLREYDSETQSAGDENISLKEALSDIVENFDVLKKGVSEEMQASIKGQIDSVLRRQIDGGISHWVGRV